MRTAAGWLQMAEQTRTIAEGMRDPFSKRQMLDIADSYEALAAHADFLAAAQRICGVHR